MSSNTLTPASISPSPAPDFKAVMVLSLRLKLRFLNFFNDALLPNFENIVEREFLIIGFQQLEDVFSIAGTNRRACLQVLCLGANDVR